MAGSIVDKVAFVDSLPWWYTSPEVLIVMRRSGMPVKVHRAWPDGE